MVLSGDYEFLTTMYGLSGSSGVRPCLFCHCEKKSMQLSRAERPPVSKRSLVTLEQDLQSFTASGGALQHAKHHNNVIRHAILPLSLQQICLPMLHLDLGIFPYLYDAFCAEVRGLDTALVKCPGLIIADTDPTEFKALVQAHNLVEEKRDTLAAAEQECKAIVQQLQYVILHAQQHGMQSVQVVASTLQLQWKEKEQQQQQAEASLASSTEELKKLVDKSGKASGPCFESLEKVLQNCNIKRQAYHSGAFIGNHIHRALRPNTIRALTSAPLQTVNSRQMQPSTSVAETELSAIVETATVIQSRYEALLTEYAECRSIFSGKAPVSSRSRERLDAKITAFMSNCRKEIVARRLGHITPKLHLLEEHVLECMDHFGMGLALLGEQGMESIHACFNKLNTTFTAIPSARDRLRTCAEQHFHATLPQNAAFRPKTVPRKRKSSTSD